MQKLTDYQHIFSEFLEGYIYERKPANLYDPVNYILKLGGKRLRPLLTLMATEAFEGDVHKALNAALSIEVFHNFSLVHDDIMDAAPLRRGMPTVHHKWDVNTGILSGDAMLIMAYQLFENYEPKTFQALAKLFSKTAIEVCEGQQYDMDFEQRDNVQVDDYLKMIEYKTAVLVGASLQMGAIVSGADDENQKYIYNFGKNLGIAFQLQDDYLDAFGDPKTFGKQVGGDIIENKKTYLYIKALESSDIKQHQVLSDLYSADSQVENEDKIHRVKTIFKATGAAEKTQEAIKAYTSKAFDILESISITDSSKSILRDFGIWLMNRRV